MIVTVYSDTYKEVKEIDPITNLAINIVAVLTTYVTEEPETFIRAAGQSDYEKTQALLATLQKRWAEAEDKEAAQILARFEERPKRYGTTLTDILKETLARDKELTDEVTRRLEEIKVTLEVIQTGRGADEVVGVEAKELLGGRIKVSQKIERTGHGQKITGVKLDRLGKE